eukprot:scaffold1554_cov261-Pinguiococcus_pyrenoidosus.AAC.7
MFYVRGVGVAELLLEDETKDLPGASAAFVEAEASLAQAVRQIELVLLDVQLGQHQVRRLELGSEVLLVLHLADALKRVARLRTLPFEHEGDAHAEQRRHALSVVRQQIDEVLLGRVDVFRSSRQKKSVAFQDPAFDLVAFHVAPLLQQLRDDAVRLTGRLVTTPSVPHVAVPRVEVNLDHRLQRSFSPDAVLPREVEVLDGMARVVGVAGMHAPAIVETRVARTSDVGRRGSLDEPLHFRQRPRVPRQQLAELGKRAVVVGVVAENLLVVLEGWRDLSLQEKRVREDADPTFQIRSRCAHPQQSLAHLL